MQTQRRPDLAPPQDDRESRALGRAYRRLLRELARQAAQAGQAGKPESQSNEGGRVTDAPDS